MKKAMGIILSAAVISSLLTVNVNADDEHPEVGYGYYEGYELHCSGNGFQSDPDNLICWRIVRDREKPREHHIFFVPVRFSEQQINGAIRVPTKWNGRKVHYIEGSCGFEAFDLDPENEYMKCADNVIFSKDGKKLMSYAQKDKREEYTIPEGTEVIGYKALYGCDSLKTVTFPESICEIGERAFTFDECLTEVKFPENSKLKKIGDYAFCGCDGLSEIWLPSFEISVARHAFAYDYSVSREIALKSYVKPNVTAEDGCIKWEKIPGASYYEVYQKLGSGEYRLVSTAKGTSCRLAALKPGKEYVFAVKPFAVIDSQDGDEWIFDHECPDSFTIEGTVSEDILVKV